jgi:hypothetical protein
MVVAPVSSSPPERSNNDMIPKMIFAGTILGGGAMVQAGWFSLVSEPAAVALVFAALGAFGLMLRRRQSAATAAQDA